MTEELINGIPVDHLSYEQIVSDLSEYLKKQQQMTVTSINPQIVIEAQKYPEVEEYIKESTHRIPDGIGIVLVSQLTGGKIKDRIAGFDLMKQFLDYANHHKKSAFFYGAKPEVLKDMLNNLAIEYPDLVISGAIDGFTKLSEDEVVKKINQVKPDFLFVAMGFPKQEQWLFRNKGVLEASILQDVGGSFDVLSGHVKRAPQLYIKLHLEWLYRSLSNPKRIGRILQLPLFVIRSLWWKFREERSN
ncbi:WecB/TagA/CpsF family glycosyltransferase [Candidatus Enterococcus willemsii]|uniref:N-acetylglucosaminyldiphosphoundecaprenol N-acetyl-beta-D-mannosaminyltransferase n=1 Tax=Candidatus Enterococcus willemsii TaxID=1857215 RepID=A0ABQ6Z218_9ENTE|nr:WecB/TagA/CpsF family glycosyltransferase [Enterococcus sp. CU12B]KAF1305056.1 glycosyl transferase [Enterococcus sp. CU12B]